MVGSKNTLPTLQKSLLTLPGLPTLRENAINLCRVGNVFLLPTCPLAQNGGQAGLSTLPGCHSQNGGQAGNVGAILYGCPVTKVKCLSRRIEGSCCPLTHPTLAEAISKFFHAIPAVFSTIQK